MRKQQNTAFWMKRTHETCNVFPMHRATPRYHLVMADGEGGEGGGGNDGKGGGPAAGYVPENLLKEAYAARDAAKDEAKKTNAQLTEMGAALKSLQAIVGENPEEFQKQLEELRNFRKTADDKNKSDIDKLTAELETLRNGSKAEIEKLTGAHGQTLKELGDKIAAHEATIAELRTHKLNSEIYKAAAENKAANPEQVVRMLTGDFELNDKGEYIHKGATPKGTPIDMTVAEHCKAFLEDEANANLLMPAEGGQRKTNMPGGSPGSTGGDGKGGKGDGKDGKGDGKDGKGDGKDGKTYLEKLGRPLTEEDKRRFMGLEPEEMAQQLYFEAEAARKDAERKKAWEQANPGLEPGMVKF